MLLVDFKQLVAAHYSRPSQLDVQTAIGQTLFFRDSSAFCGWVNGPHADDQPCTSRRHATQINKLLQKSKPSNRG